MAIFLDQTEFAVMFFMLIFRSKVKKVSKKSDSNQSVVAISLSTPPSNVSLDSKKAASNSAVVVANLTPSSSNAAKEVNNLPLKGAAHLPAKSPTSNTQISPSYEHRVTSEVSKLPVKSNLVKPAVNPNLVKPTVKPSLVKQTVKPSLVKPAVPVKVPTRDHVSLSSSKAQVDKSVAYQAGGNQPVAMNRETNKYGVLTVVNPFESIPSAATSTPVPLPSDLAATWKGGKDSQDTNNDMKTLKSETFDQSVRSILDYAASYETTMKRNTSDKPIAYPRSQLKAEKSAVIPRKYLPPSSVDSHHLHDNASLKDPVTSTTNKGSTPIWSQKAAKPHSFPLNSSYPPHSLSHSTQPSKLISPPSHHMLIPPSHHSDSSLLHMGSSEHLPQHSSKLIYKTPPKESPRSKSITPPQSSPKTISPHHIGSGASSRTSPLVHFPSGLDHKRRMSGHSPEDKRVSPAAAISHSVNR